MPYQATFRNDTSDWPYPIKYDDVTKVETDVLIVGGGLSGGMAGLAAARRGVKVAVADKAPIKRSGSGGAGIDHYNTCISNPKSPITPEEYMELPGSNTDLCHTDYIALKGSWDALMELERLGLKIRDENNEFAGAPTLDEETGLLKGYDYKNVVSFKLRDGHNIKTVIYNGLKNEENVSLFERVMITSLLTDSAEKGAKVVGATGFHLQTGEFYVFSAKTVILACAEVAGIWTYNTELTGNGYAPDPNCVGDGFAMAWKAGALARLSHEHKRARGNSPFGWPNYGIGTCDNTWFPCSIVDSDGKEVPWEDINGNPVPTVEARNIPVEGQPYICSSLDQLGGIQKPTLVLDLPERIRNGEYRLPFYADLAGMPEKERRSIWGLMIGNEGKTRYSVYDHYIRAGFNPDLDMLQVPVMAADAYGGIFKDWFHGETNIVKPWKEGKGRLITDWNNMTNVDGLFCGGLICAQLGASNACSSGLYVGNRAAEYALCSSGGEIDESQVAAERKRIYAPSLRLGDPDAYVGWKELWAGTTRVMQQDCGELKTVSTLRHGLMWLESIRKQELQQTYARNPHELARLLECESRITAAGMFLHACIARLEADERYPGEERTINIQKAGEDSVWSVVEKDYWLKAPYAPTYKENYERCRANEV